MNADALAQPHLLKLTGRSEVALDTLEVRFAKPPGLTFKAGQSMDVTLIDPPETDAKGNTRALSINTAPDDPDLAFTTRLRDSAFKRVLRTLPLGAEVRAEGPFGNFVLHNNVRRPAVLLAGGIGITPFRSIVHWAAQAKLPHRIYLFYANHTPETAPFVDELRALEQKNPNFTFIPTVTRMKESHAKWSGETGRIDAAMLEKHMAQTAPASEPFSTPIYYIAGPASMVAAMHAMLNRTGIDDDDIKSEEFSGY